MMVVFLGGMLVGSVLTIIVLGLCAIADEDEEREKRDGER